jgi:hypothetical protein
MSVAAVDHRTAIGVNHEPEMMRPWTQFGHWPELEARK